MGFLITGDTGMQIYLTEYGKTKMLEQQFTIASFTINDSDVNYLTQQVMDKSVVDISGDYDNNVFSLSKHRNIKGSIIYRVALINGTTTVINGTTTVGATTTGTASTL